MSVFITSDFLLQTEAARRLYHDFARDLPIIDYHCHLPPKDVAEDRRFSNLSQIWLAGDHYKWRAMRAAGVDEPFITGNASDWEKFFAWADVTPLTLRNPLYHWTHLELNRPFGINDRLLGPDTAKSVWNDANAKLQLSGFSARGIMRQMNVQLVCTTDDPADSLQWHQQIAADENFDIQVLPTFRPDKALQFADVLQHNNGVTEESVAAYNAYLDRLAAAAGMAINTLDDLLNALKKRHDFFHQNGCRLSDHGFTHFHYKYGIFSASQIFTRLRRGEAVKEPQGLIALQSVILRHIARLNAKRGWTMQLHLGAIRNNNSKMFRELGPDAGFDSIGNVTNAGELSRFFDSLDRSDELPKTIVYNLNPADNAMLATMIGNFQNGGHNGCPGKMQFGSGWWFLDQKDGMEEQLNTLSSLGLLSQFVGMLTDSRSFLSYTRHEYFRRILCNLLGHDMQQGLLPNDFTLVGNMVQDICYRNAKKYFGFVV